MMSKTKEGGLAFEPRLDFRRLPDSYKPTKDLPPAKQIDMKTPLSACLPRLKITLHSVKELRKDGCCVEVHFGNAAPFRSTPAKKSTHTFGNEEYVFCLEPVTQPFLCLIRAIKTTAGGLGKAEVMGQIACDISQDLGLRFSGEQRRHTFPLLPKGEVVLTFQPLTNLQFPTMMLQNVDGTTNTSSLPMRQLPEIQLMIYQTIRLKGAKILQTKIDVQHKTYNLTALPGVNPEKKLNILSTPIVKGYSPFYGVGVKIPISCKGDEIKISMEFLHGRTRGKEVICKMGVEELAKLATATESRRWYAFPITHTFQGACLGIGFTAMSNMSTIRVLPDTPTLFGGKAAITVDVVPEYKHTSAVIDVSSSSDPTPTAPAKRAIETISLERAQQLQREKTITEAEAAKHAKEHDLEHEYSSESLHTFGESEMDGFDNLHHDDIIIQVKTYGSEWDQSEGSYSTTEEHDPHYQDTGPRRTLDRSLTAVPVPSAPKPNPAISRAGGTLNTTKALPKLNSPKLLVRSATEMNYNSSDDLNAWGDSNVKPLPLPGVPPKLKTPTIDLYRNNTTFSSSSPAVPYHHEEQHPTAPKLKNPSLDHFKHNQSPVGGSPAKVSPLSGSGRTLDLWSSNAPSPATTPSTTPATTPRKELPKPEMSNPFRSRESLQRAEEAAGAGATIDPWNSNKSTKTVSPVTSPWNSNKEESSGGGYGYDHQDEIEFDPLSSAKIPPIIRGAPLTQSSPTSSNQMEPLSPRSAKPLPQRPGEGGPKPTVNPIAPLSHPRVPLVKATTELSKIHAKSSAETLLSPFRVASKPGLPLRISASTPSPPTQQPVSPLLNSAKAKGPQRKPPSAGRGQGHPVISPTFVAVAPLKRSKMDDYDDILSEVSKAEASRSTGPSGTGAAGEIPVSAHVRALLLVLDSMAPKFHVDNQKISWRNTIKLQNFSFLISAETQLTEQLERLEIEAVQTSYMTIEGETDWLTLSFEEEKKKLFLADYVEEPTVPDTPDISSFNLEDALSQDLISEDQMNEEDIDAILAGSIKPRKAELPKLEVTKPPLSASDPSPRFTRSGSSGLSPRSALRTNPYEDFVIDDSVELGSREEYYEPNDEPIDEPFEEPNDEPIEDPYEDPNDEPIEELEDPFEDPIIEDPIIEEPLEEPLEGLKYEPEEPIEPVYDEPEPLEEPLEEPKVEPKETVHVEPEPKEEPKIVLEEPKDEPKTEEPKEEPKIEPEETKQEEPKLQETKRDVSSLGSTKPQVSRSTTTVQTKTQVPSASSQGRVAVARSQTEVPSGVGGNIACALCRKQHPPSSMTLLRGKEFCPTCADRMTKSAQGRGLALNK